MKKQILAICGSVRKGSFNQALLKYIKQSFRDELSIEIYDKMEALPIFNPDLEGPLLPPIVKALQQKIEQADGVIISTPEYVFSLPGNLKNLLEWNVASTIFSKKPVALIVAAASGEKAFESLDLVMATITCQPIPSELKLLFKGIGNKINANGNLTDAKMVDEIKALMIAFSQSINNRRI